MPAQTDPAVTDHIARFGVTRCPTLPTYDQLPICGLEVGNEDLLGIPPGLASEEFVQRSRNNAAKGRAKAKGWRAGDFVFGKRTQ